MVPVPTNTHIAWLAIMAEAHYSGRDVGPVFRGLIEAASRRPIARAHLASTEARRNCPAIRAAFALAHIFAAPAGARPCDRCGAPTALHCEECPAGEGDFAPEPLCSVCEEQCGTCLHCEHDNRAIASAELGTLGGNGNAWQ